MRMLKRFIGEWRKITRKNRKSQTVAQFANQYRKTPVGESTFKNIPQFRNDIRPRSVEYAADIRAPAAHGTKALAVCEPVLIPYSRAQDMLKEAIRKITDDEGYKILNVYDLHKKQRTYIVKNGIWAGSKMRMFFAKNRKEKLERFYIGTNACGYPVLRDPLTPQEAEVRIVTVEEMPQAPKDEKNQKNDPDPLETISPDGELPSWALRIKEIIETKDVCTIENQGRERSLIEIADELHETACDILGLNPEKIPLRDDVEAAFKGRIRVVHPDVVRTTAEDAENIAQALLWAKKFLYPFN